MFPYIKVSLDNKQFVVRLFDRFYRINPNAVKANPFGVRLPAADIFASIEELKVLTHFCDKNSILVKTNGFTK